MKNRIFRILSILMALALCACTAQQLPSEAVLTYPSTKPTAATHPTAAPTDETVPPATGWQTTAAGTYYLLEDGSIHTGWLELEEGTYYLNTDGTLYSGWLELDGSTYYLSEDGKLHTGGRDAGVLRRYFREDGTLASGWVDDGSTRYYLNEDGTAYSGWLELDGSTYYIRQDGSMARGQVEIDGVNYFFTSAGAPILLVNPWNYLPSDYVPSLVWVNNYYATTATYVDRSCYDALMQMLKDCNANSGARGYVVSGYRSYNEQTVFYQRKVDQYLSWGYSRASAEAAAATTVAVPGTSEHHLGLAVDIIDTDLWELCDAQAEMPGQVWLMEHCWEYGFILRYPADKSDSTGIIYEPWHYRYVGVDVARELQESGLTLEEYIANLH